MSKKPQKLKQVIAGTSQKPPSPFELGRMPNISPPEPADVKQHLKATRDNNPDSLAPLGLQPVPPDPTLTEEERIRKSFYSRNSLTPDEPRSDNPHPYPPEKEDLPFLQSCASQVIGGLLARIGGVNPQAPDPNMLRIYTRFSFDLAERMLSEAKTRYPHLIPKPQPYFGR